MKQLEFKHIKTEGKKWIDIYLYCEILSDQSQVYNIHTIFYDGEKEVCRFEDTSSTDYSEAFEKFVKTEQGLSILGDSE